MGDLDPAQARLLVLLLPASESCRMLAALTRFRGAKRGANVGRRQAAPGDNEPRFPQLDRPSGHSQPRAATTRMRLKIGRPTGFADRDDELALLAGLLDAFGMFRPVAASAVAGWAGVGKTTRAVRLDYELFERPATAACLRLCSMKARYQ